MLMKRGVLDTQTITFQTASSVTRTSMSNIDSIGPQNKTDLSTILWYIVPGYMEEKRISETLEYLTELIETLTTYNIKLIPVLIDDGSTDNTYKLMQTYLKETSSFARKIEHGGRGAALQAGINLVNKKHDLKLNEIIVLSAADLKMPLNDFLDSCDYINRDGWNGVFFSKNVPGSIMIRSYTRRILAYSLISYREFYSVLSTWILRELNL
jgi:glycosyltransferase involved in cell wall biosynthesis